MAKILGEIGKYPSEQAQKYHLRILIAGLAAFAVLGVIFGINIGWHFPISKQMPWGFVAAELALGAASFGTGVYSVKKMDAFERIRRSMRKGADGETRVGQILAEFPASFQVFNGLATPFGDLDHIVMGPTGVFVVDSKNWRGVVSADGKGELMLNGKPTTKAPIRAIVSRTMNVKEKIQALCDFELPYFQVVLAFTSARVDARWGTTGKALCVNEEGLYDLIVENKNGGKLSAHQVDTIARALSSVTTMQRDI